ncbi:MAG TPA: hypothetical protein VMW87_16450 [Spirochaetia bacterium]|nr:hypothetical protein [Spirochaetia bacterium]
MADQSGNSSPPGPRAEQLIVGILAEKKRHTEAGTIVSRVLLSPEQYRTLQEYRARLGDAPSISMEYLTRYEIFGLQICVERARSAETPPEVQ